MAGVKTEGKIAKQGKPGGHREKREETGNEEKRRKHRKIGGNKEKHTLGTRGFSRVKKLFARVTMKTCQKPETALGKSLPPR